jgi:hypothetical protein
MNRDDIIRMAREAGAATGSPAPNAPEIIFTQCLDIERFANLVAAAEREACAKVCEQMPTHVDRHNAVTQASATDCAAAIRARGDT